MSIDTIRTEPGGPTAKQRVLDVSDITASEVRAFVRASTVESGESVHLERRGGRTYLVAG